MVKKTERHVEKKHVKNKEKGRYSNNVRCVNIQRDKPSLEKTLEGENARTKRHDKRKKILED